MNKPIKDFENYLIYDDGRVFRGVNKTHGGFIFKYL